MPCLTRPGNLTGMVWNDQRTSRPWQSVLQHSDSSLLPVGYIRVTKSAAASPASRAQCASHTTPTVQHRHSVASREVCLWTGAPPQQTCHHLVVDCPLEIATHLSSGSRASCRDPGEAWGHLVAGTTGLGWGMQEGGIWSPLPTSWPRGVQRVTRRPRAASINSVHLFYPALRLVCHHGTGIVIAARCTPCMMRHCSHAIHAAS
jgi:hypothetical protein